MKTPREVLLQRHQAVARRLDQIRHVTIASLQERSTVRDQTLPIAIILKLWRELIWPCRRIWAGLAAVWLVLAVFNLTHAEHGKTAVAKSSPPSAEVRIAFQEQQRLLAEILGPPRAAAPAEPPRRSNPRPRSERQTDKRTSTVGDEITRLKSLCA